DRCPDVLGRCLLYTHRILLLSAFRFEDITSCLPKSFRASSAKQGTVAPSNNTHAVNTIECRAITASHKVQLTESNECRRLELADITLRLRQASHTKDRAPADYCR